MVREALRKWNKRQAATISICFDRWGGGEEWGGPSGQAGSWEDFGVQRMRKISINKKQIKAQLPKQGACGRGLATVFFWGSTVWLYPTEHSFWEINVLIFHHVILGQANSYESLLCGTAPTKKFNIFFQINLSPNMPGLALCLFPASPAPPPRQSSKACWSTQSQLSRNPRRPVLPGVTSLLSPLRLRVLTTQSVVCGPATRTTTGRVSGLPRHTESEFAL